MRIGIDAFPLSGNIAGIGRYVFEISKILCEKLKGADFFLYSRKPIKMSIASSRVHYRTGGIRMPSSYSWLKFCVGTMARKDKVDIFWSTRTILPLQTKIFKTVSTVHDLNHLLFPKSMPLVTLIVHKLWFNSDIQKADAVVANSIGTSKRLNALLGVKVDAIARPGVSSPFGLQSTEFVKARLSALKISNPYFLTVGTVEPRKNFPTLIKAFISLKNQGELAQYGLLIVGSQGWKSRTFLSQLDESKKYGIRWLGFVKDEDLAALYAGSKAFILPSLYEGFGIPVAEARACGAQIIASDIPELREAGGPKGIYVKPTIKGICEALLQVANSPNGTVLDYGKPPSWAEAGDTMVDVFKTLMEKSSA